MASAERVPRPGNDDVARVPSVEYTGYQLLCRNDLSYAEDKSRDSGHEEKGERMSLKDISKTSKSLVLSLLCLGVCFIILLVWQILIPMCKVNALCETIDESSTLRSSYLFRSLSFRVPSALVWIGLTCGVFGFLYTSFQALLILRMPVGTAAMSGAASGIRMFCASLFAYQHMYPVIPFIAIFILLGVGINWRTAGCWFTGAVTSSVTSQTILAIATRANVRVTAASRFGIQNAMDVAFRGGSTIVAATLSIGAVGSSATYFLSLDIRALAGLAAGACCMALFSGMSSNAFSFASQYAALQSGGRPPLKSDIGEGGTKASSKQWAKVSSRLSSFASSGSDLVASLASAVIATAIIGSALPYFFFNSFAMCVFNHLSIDQTCGPFGYPNKLSYATYICRNGPLYVEYPVLKTWASNSAFVAAPFLFATIAILVSIVSTVFALRSEEAALQSNDPTEAVRKLRRNLLFNKFVGYALAVAGVAGLCFGLFGTSSEFQKAKGLGKTNNLQSMELDGSPQQCVSKFLNVNIDGGLSPLPVPQGGVLKSKKYRPMMASGRHHGDADETPWRLFICALLGILLAELIAGVVSQCSFAARSNDTANELSELGSGIEMHLIQTIGDGMLSTVMPTILLVVAIASSFVLYGSYGTGFTSLGFLCCAGICTASSATGSLASSAHALAYVTNSNVAKRNAQVLGKFGDTTRASEAWYLSTASALSSCAVLLAAIQQSGLVPSPRSLIGSPERTPEQLIGENQIAPLVETSVIVSFLCGVTLPIFIAGVLLVESSVAADRLYFEESEQRREGRAASLQSHQIARSVTARILVPFAASILSPLIIGFGFGQRALIGFTIGMVACGFVWGSFLMSLSVFWWSSERNRLSRSRTVSSVGQMPTLSESCGVVCMQGCAGYSVQALGKVAASVALVVVTIMHPDGRQGWIGGVILAVALSFLLVYIFTQGLRASKRSGSSTNNADDGSLGPVPPKRISPFYEDGPTIDPATVLPGSQAHEALQALGSPTVPVSPLILPGLSDRDNADMTNRVEILTPRAAMPIAKSVFLDDARAT